MTQGYRVICYRNHIYLNMWVIQGFLLMFMESMVGTISIATSVCNFLDDASLPNERS